MTTIDEDRLLEPWQDAAFRADLAALAGHAAEASRRFAAEAVLLSRLAARVPRTDWDTRGATAWTSLLAEVVVARSVSTPAAAVQVAEAQQLVSLMPCTLRLLRQGRLPLARARALLDASRACPDEVVRLVDAELAERAVLLVPARVRGAVERLALQHEVDLAARRQAEATRGRRTRFSPLPDGQAEFALVGPALPLAQYAAALDSDARAWHRALAGTGDSRGLDQLRFDLALQRGLAHHAQPADAVSGPLGTPVDGRVRTSAGGPDAESALEPVAVPVSGLAGGSATEACATTTTGESVPGDPSAPSWWTDRRFTRPVQLGIQVPVTTALGLSQEPGWLPGYGWVAAPQVRQLLPVAELRQLCLATAESGAAGQLVDVADLPVRPAASAEGVRTALLRMAGQPCDITGKTWRSEPRHDPSPALAGFAALRDRSCDGPTGTRVPSTRADLDHDHRWTGPPAHRDRADTRAEGLSDSRPVLRPDAGPGTARHGDLGLALDPRTGWLTASDLAHPDAAEAARHLALLGAAGAWYAEEADVPHLPSAEGHQADGHQSEGGGPTAAWNLVARSRRAHGLKHRGWTPLRTATSTLWFTPAGQVVEVPHEAHPIGPLPQGQLLDPDSLRAREARLLTAEPPPPQPPQDEVPRDPEPPPASQQWPEPDF